MRSWKWKLRNFAPVRMRERGVREAAPYGGWRVDGKISKKGANFSLLFG